MVGDWVNIAVEGYNNPTRIREIGSFWVKVIRDEMEYGNILVTPIPLTTEILEKNGFKSCKEGYDIGIPLLYWDKYCTAVCGWTHCDDLIEVFDCRYVHQLQHALKLCGITKEIEL